MLFMYYAVFKFRELAAVPTACSAYKISGDALELVDPGSSAMRTFGQILLCILITAVHAAVSVMVD